MTRIFAILAVCLLMVTGALEAGTEGAIDKNLQQRLAKQFESSPDAERLINAVSNNDIKSLSLNRDLVVKHDRLFRYEVKGTDIINQRSSGRCWMFAGVNVVAPKVMTKLKMSDFEISEAYLAFWDKMEKSNRYLEKMIALRDKPLTDRSLQMYLEGPLGDGGWWHYFTDLINKYGVVPASVMPESKQSSSTGTINRLINTKLRQATGAIRRMNENGKTVKQMRAYKEDVLSDIYNLLVFGYGQPPAEFDYRYRTEEDSTKVVVERTFTPLGFFHEFYGDHMPEYVAISNNPAMEYQQLYQMDGGRNIEEAADMQVLNMPIEKLKHYAEKSLLDSQIVWFACDVGKDNYNDSGVFAVDIYDYNATFDMDFNMSKADRIMFHDMSPNHAMVLTGLDTIATGEPFKWKVENSWGSDRGDKGYWTMYDNWFDEYVLLVIVDRSLLEPEDRELFAQKPKVIADWEPFFLALRNLQW